AVDDGVGAADIAPVELHGPVAGDDPAGEAAPLAHEIVVFHALPAVPALGGPLRQPAVDEGVVLRLQHVGEGVDEVQLGAEILPQRGAHGGDVGLRGEGEANLGAHLRQDAGTPAPAVGGQIAPEVAVGVALRA